MEYSNQSKEVPQAPDRQQQAFNTSELPSDERAIELDIESAQAEHRQVNDAVARCIASQLHDGQGSALHGLASTGNLGHDNLDAELRTLYNDPNPQIRQWASALGLYALHREDKGLVEGWSALRPASPEQTAADSCPPAVEPATTEPEQPVAAVDVEQIEPGRVRRGEFVYVDSCPYATDPATLLGVQVGDRIAVTTRRPHARQVDSYESDVLSVGQDGFGLYLGVEWDDPHAGVRWSSTASTVVDEIRLVRQEEQTPGSTADRPLAEAGDDLLQRIDAVVAALGQAATNDVEAEVDTFPWSDAVRWLPDEGWVDELGSPAEGGIPNALLEQLFTRVPEAQLGSTDQMGWCGLLCHADRTGGVILRQNQYGRRWGWATDSDEELQQRWAVRSHKNLAAWRTSSKRSV